MKNTSIPRLTILFTVILHLLAATGLAADPYTVENTNLSGLELIKDESVEPSEEDGTLFDKIPNGSSLTKNYRITNTSALGLKLSQFQSSNPRFVPSPSEPQVIVTPGGTFSFTIRFDAGIGEETSIIEIFTDAPGNFEVFEFTVGGTGAKKLLYVDAGAGGANNGTSWTNAFLELQDALAAADPGDEIRIATGVYYPDQGAGQTNNARGSSFVLVPGVKVTGGYPSGGGAYDPEGNPTILSGDLQQNDSNLDGNHITESYLQIGGSNALQVVSVLDAAAEIELSGVTITGGSADAPNPQDGGAGIYVEVPSVNLALRDCNIVGNRSGTTADDGVNGDGTGVYFESLGGSLNLSGCVVAGNGLLKYSSAVDGAGLEVRDASLAMTNCLFDENFIQGASGTGNANGFAFAIFGTDVEDCTLTDVVIRNHNTTGSLSSGTSAIRAQNLASLSFSRCRFLGNAWNTSNPQDHLISTSVISSMRTVDCLFTGNEVQRLWRINSFGSGEPQSLTFLNTTVAGNDATSFLYGGTNANGIISIGNCYVDESIDPNVISSFNIFRSHSAISGFPADGNGNLSSTTNPMFINPRPATEAPTTAGDYRLLPDSPLLDAGSNAATTSTLDLDGNARVQDGDGNGSATIDIGAFEVVPTGGPAEITAINYNENTGQVTLTVESTAAVSYTVEFSTTMTTGSWTSGPTGTLSVGTNTIPLPENTYNGPQPRTTFRIVTP